MWPLLLAAFLAQEDKVSQHAAAAVAAMQEGKYALAEQHHREIVRLSPELAEARVNLGLSCFLQKKYAEAIEAFESGLKRNPDLANARLFLGIAQFNLNRPSQAVPALREYTRIRPDDFQGHYFLGLSLLNLEHFPEAEQALLTARRIDHSNIDALYHLAQSYIGQARQKPSQRDSLWRSYRAAVRQIASLEPGSYRIGQLQAGYYEAIGEKKKAIEELEKLLQPDLRVRGLHYTLACLYVESHLYDKALEQLQAELRLDAPYPRTHLQLGHVYLALQRPDEALPALRLAREIEPESSGTVWVELGRAYMMMDRPGEAAAAFESAIRQGERKSSVYYQLAMAYRKAGRLEKFREALAVSERIRNEGKPQ